jgi:hypothetical protein
MSDMNDEPVVATPVVAAPVLSDQEQARRCRVVQNWKLTQATRDADAARKSLNAEARKVGVKIVDKVARSEAVKDERKRLNANEKAARRAAAERATCTFLIPALDENGRGKTVATYIAKDAQGRQFRGVLQVTFVESGRCYVQGEGLAIFD